MKAVLKSGVRRALDVLGWELNRKRRGTLGSNAYQDMSTLLSGTPAPVCLDVGANVGQTVPKLKTLLPTSVVHSFEPGAKAFETLQQVAAQYSSVKAHQIGLGSRIGQQMLQEHRSSQWSSFLPPGAHRVDQVVQTTAVQVTTVDKYCESSQIPHVHVLKTDTQGFDYEVLKGAERLMRGNRIKLIYMEVIFADLYEGLPPFDEVFRFLLDHRFKLVSFYQFYHRDNVAAWSDALFVNKGFDDSIHD